MKELNQINQLTKIEFIHKMEEIERSYFKAYQKQINELIELGLYDSYAEIVLHAVERTVEQDEDGVRHACFTTGYLVWFENNLEAIINC